MKLLTRSLGERLLVSKRIDDSKAAVLLRSIPPSGVTHESCILGVPCITWLADKSTGQRVSSLQISLLFIYNLGDAAFESCKSQELPEPCKICILSPVRFAYFLNLNEDLTSVVYFNLEEFLHNTYSLLFC